ncbi:MAG: glycosyltransferase family 1 protein [Candidatus Riflebacteria bacterium HGW-Riflebacteria-1]|jgi:glycosyltransferase involved in cell wall biosynthesis|nr:MAG: glycosyltransferase family 1 protein [Candidatus Riflebacteria bacterium HGW-Riflebacteria-1]
MFYSERMKRIAILESSSRSLINFRGSLIQTLCQLGHEVFCVAPDAWFADEVRALASGFATAEVARCGLNPVDDILYYQRLYQLLQKNRPDVILAYTIKPIVYGTMAARNLGISEIYALITGLGYSFMNVSYHQKLTGLLAKSLYRRTLRFDRRVFFQNPDDREEFINLNIVEASKTSLVNGSGVDLQHFAQQKLPDGPPTFLLIARLLRDKGIMEYIEAAASLRKVFPTARFQLLGPADPSPSGLPLSAIERYTEAGVIEYLGATRDVRPFLQQAGVFVLPSYREGLPRTVVEAMATGRPIITTDAPGCRQTVREGENGFLVPVRDAGALAAAMRRFIENPHLIASMGEASRRRAVQNYNVHEINRAIIEATNI